MEDFGIELDDEDIFLMCEEDEEEKNEEIADIIPEKYKLNDNVSRYKQMSNILALFYHAKCGEPMGDVFDFLSGTTFNETHDQSLLMYLEK